MSLPEDIEQDAKDEMSASEKRARGLEQCDNCLEWYHVAELEYVTENKKRILCCSKCQELYD